MTAQGDGSYDYAHFTDEGNEAQRDGVAALRWDTEAGQEVQSVSPKACGFRHHQCLVQDQVLPFQCPPP